MNFLHTQTPGTRILPSTCVLRILAAPNARQTQIAGEQEGWLRLRVAAAPESGHANEAIRDFLAQKLDIAKSQVRLLSGSGSKRKRFALECSAEKIVAALVGSKDAAR